MPGPARDFSKPHTREFRGTTRRNVVVLPVSNDLPAPPPPAGVTFTDDELDVWAGMWATGESSQWSDAALTPVAVLVRLLSRLYGGMASTAEIGAADRLMAALGLTPAARSRLGWEMAP
jgi:hypothetical protein